MTKRRCKSTGPGLLGISRTFTVALAAAIAIVANVLSAEDAKPVRLFILSGQSNMAGLNPDLSYTPTVTAAFADEEVIVVKSAQGGQPIRRWYKKWQPPEGRTSPSPADGALYDTLLTAVQKRLGDKRPASIVFVWMQGERDAKEKFASVYEASLTGVVQQLKDDLHCDTIGVVVGRLSDCRNNDADWLALRAAQESFAKNTPLAVWVDTDDLNGDKNDLHYTKPGYVELGRRFAEQSIDLARKTKK